MLLPGETGGGSHVSRGAQKKKSISKICRLPFLHASFPKVLDYAGSRSRRIDTLQRDTIIQSQVRLQIVMRL